MNLVGKIFVVLTLILSLVLMSLTVVVYMTQVNWMRMANNTDTQNGYPLGLKQQLKDCQTENQELRSTYAKKASAYEKQLQISTNAAKEVDVVKNSQIEEVSKLRNTIDTKYQETNDRLDKTEAALGKMNSIQINLRDSVVSLQSEIASIANKLKRNSDYENQIAEFKLQLKNLEKENKRLSNENSLAINLLNFKNIEFNKTEASNEYYSSLAPPTKIQGRVIQAAGRKVMVNIGSDDGIHEGHTFHLLSPDGSQYLCDVVVESVKTDTAICVFSNLRSEQSINVVNGCIVKP